MKNLPRRAWVNQPSTYQPFHYLHGVNVLAIVDTDDVDRIYFLSGPVEWQQIPSNTLVDGWLRNPAPTPGRNLRARLATLAAMLVLTLGSIVSAPAVDVAPPSEENVIAYEQEQAEQSAQAYLQMGGFSRSSLIKQLLHEEFSAQAATRAVDAISPDWNEQAEKSARDYLDMGGFSRRGLLAQLRHEGFTAEQAAYAVNQVYRK